MFYLVRKVRSFVCAVRVIDMSAGQTAHTYIRIRLTIETVARTHLWLLVEYARDRTPSILMVHAVLQLDNFTIGHHHSIFSSQAAETLSTPCLTCRRRRPSPSRSGAAPSIRRHRELVLACFADLCLICFDKK